MGCAGSKEQPHSATTRTHTPKSPSNVSRVSRKSSKRSWKSLNSRHSPDLRSESKNSRGQSSFSASQTSTEEYINLGSDLSHQKSREQSSPYATTLTPALPSAFLHNPHVGSPSISPAAPSGWDNYFENSRNKSQGSVQSSKSLETVRSTPIPPSAVNFDTTAMPPRSPRMNSPHLHPSSIQTTPSRVFEQNTNYPVTTTMSLPASISDPALSTSPISAQQSPQLKYVIPPSPKFKLPPTPEPEDDDLFPPTDAISAESLFALAYTPEDSPPLAEANPPQQYIWQTPRTQHQWMYDPRLYESDTSRYDFSEEEKDIQNFSDQSQFDQNRPQYSEFSQSPSPNQFFIPVKHPKNLLQYTLFQQHHRKLERMSQMQREQALKKAESSGDEYISESDEGSESKLKRPVTPEPKSPSLMEDNTQAEAETNRSGSPRLSLFEDYDGESSSDGFEKMGSMITMLNEQSWDKDEFTAGEVEWWSDEDEKHQDIFEDFSDQIEELDEEDYDEDYDEDALEAGEPDFEFPGSHLNTEPQVSGSSLMDTIEESEEPISEIPENMKTELNAIAISKPIATARSNETLNSPQSPRPSISSRRSNDSRMRNSPNRRKPPVCAFCEEEVDLNALEHKNRPVHMVGRLWHREHSRCAECFKPVAGPGAGSSAHPGSALSNELTEGGFIARPTHFAEIDGYIYCEDHYFVLQGQYHAKTIGKRQKSSIESELREIKANQTVRRVRNLLNFEKTVRLQVITADPSTQSQADKFRFEISPSTTPEPPGNWNEKQPRRFITSWVPVHVASGRRRASVMGTGKEITAQKREGKRRGSVMM